MTWLLLLLAIAAALKGLEVGKAAAVKELIEASCKRVKVGVAVAVPSEKNATDGVRDAEAVVEGELPWDKEEVGEAVAVLLPLGESVGALEGETDSVAVFDGDAPMLREDVGDALTPLGLAEAVVDCVPDGVPVPVLLLVALGVTVPLTLALAVGLALTVLLPLSVVVGVRVPLPVLLLVRLPVPVGEGVCAAVSEPDWLVEGVMEALAPTVRVGVKVGEAGSVPATPPPLRLAEVVVEGLGVGEALSTEDRPGAAADDDESVPEGVQLGVGEEDRVGVPVELPEAVGVGVEVGEGEGV